MDEQSLINYEEFCKLEQYRKSQEISLHQDILSDKFSQRLLRKSILDRI